MHAHVQVELERGLASRPSTMSNRIRNTMTQAISASPSGYSHQSREHSRASVVDVSKLTKADLRRLARKEREAEWRDFNATRPDKQ